MFRTAIIVLSIGLLVHFAHASAAEAVTDPPQTRHQMMKSCLAKEKSAGTPKSSEEIRKTCRDLVKTQKSNQDRNPR